MPWKYYNLNPTPFPYLLSIQSRNRISAENHTNQFLNDVHKIHVHTGSEDYNETVKGTEASVFMYFLAIIIYWPLYFNAFNDFTNEIDLNSVDFVTDHVNLPVFSNSETKKSFEIYTRWHGECIYIVRVVYFPVKRARWPYRGIDR